MDLRRKDDNSKTPNFGTIQLVERKHFLETPVEQPALRPGAMATRWPQELTPIHGHATRLRTYLQDALG
jgi:hypothetical protein